MSYIGVPPQATFSSGLLDRFTSTTGTTVTLTHDIASENDIVVFVNFVKQDSTTYSVGGTGNKTLTLGGTLVSSDIVEVHYLNIVGQTNAPSAGSVGSSQLTADSITGQTAETSIADDDTIIIHDTSASALRKMTKANSVSGGGGVNTPAFSVYSTDGQSITENTYTKIEWDNENFDTANAFSSHKFTVPSGQDGKYFFSLDIGCDSNSANHFYYGVARFYKNGSALPEYSYLNLANNFGAAATISISNAYSLVAGDYIETYALIDDGVDTSVKFSSANFTGFKIIE